MEIITDYKNREEWDKFVGDNTSPASFLQAWDWGEFNEKILGNRIARWAVIDEEKLSIIFQAVIKELPFNKTYVYCPRGLVFRTDYSDRRARAYTAIQEKFKIEWASHVFLRTCPPYEYKDYVAGFMRRLGFRKPKILIHSKEPDNTILINLKKNEEELLSDLQQKTRYNIRLAEKKGVHIRIMDNESKVKDMKIFYQLSEETAKRNKIKIYEKDYYEKLAEYFGQSDKGVKSKIYLAEKDGSPLAAIMAIYFGDGATYLHGASSNENRELMPNYLLQWQAILDAKKDGYKWYDLWGVNENSGAWAGITRFKRGFGGREVKFMGAWDYVLNKKWYNIFRLLKIIKKIIP